MTNPSELARDPALTARLAAKIRAYRGRPVAIMEVCGTHTVAIARMGLRSLLPEGVRLLSGPGCPVCVTPSGAFDDALRLVLENGVTLAAYGDSLRVPGSDSTLAEARASGGDVRVVYSALDALALASQDRERPVVFFGLGFETTSPTVASAVEAAAARGLRNFSVLSAHKALLPAMEALVRDGDAGIDAFLCPGHASMVLGTQGYARLSEEYGVPCVVAGFEPNDILVGLVRILAQLEAGDCRTENAYPRAVDEEGNPAALGALGRVFEAVYARWRGLGALRASGYELRPAFAAHDARRLFLSGAHLEGREPPGCRCGEVLKGQLSPADCALFGGSCTPEHPVGACMVSSEGACGAHHRYARA